jgi:hypothetical protein
VGVQAGRGGAGAWTAAGGSAPGPDTSPCKSTAVAAWRVADVAALGLAAEPMNTSPVTKEFPDGFGIRLG